MTRSDARSHRRRIDPADALALGSMWPEPNQEARTMTAATYHHTAPEACPLWSPRTGLCSGHDAPDPTVHDLAAGDPHDCAPADYHTHDDPTDPGHDGITACPFGLHCEGLDSEPGVPYGWTACRHCGRLAEDTADGRDDRDAIAAALVDAYAEALERQRATWPAILRAAHGYRIARLDRLADAHRPAVLYWHDLAASAHVLGIVPEPGRPLTRQRQWEAATVALAAYSARPFDGRGDMTTRELRDLIGRHEAYMRRQRGRDYPALP